MLCVGTEHFIFYVLDKGSSFLQQDSKFNEILCEVEHETYRGTKRHSDLSPWAKDVSEKV